MTTTEVEALATLAWLVEAGADEAIGDAPLNRFGAQDPHSPPRPAVPSAPISQPDRFRSPVSESDSVGGAIDLARACRTLAELRAALETFDGISLKHTATSTVFADGNPESRIMVIGEAPGRDEDRQGLPFVGRAGKLLDKMLAAINLDRTRAYITNVINWRPPGNRDPSPEEVAMCMPFLRRHIELANPALLILLGAVAVRHVMGKSEGILKTRGQWLEYNVSGTMVPAMPTLHPAYLLRQPSHKNLVWRDLQAVERKMIELRLPETRAATT
jgi:DNA polymerase